MTSEPDRWVQALSARLFTRRNAEQPRAVFLHGFSADLHSWDRVWRALDNSLPALRYDLRGHGRSLAMGDIAYDHAADLLAVLDDSGLTQCDLVGVSMGGSIALNFALDHPERVRRLVLISPGLVAWEWSERWLALWRGIVERAQSGAMDEARELWWRHPLFETTRRSVAADELHQSIMRYSGAHWLHDSHRLMLPDVERLHLLSVPTLLLTGANDFDDFRLIADLIEASASDLLRIDLPALGHLLQLEASERCAVEILAFLS